MAKPFFHFYAKLICASLERVFQFLMRDDINDQEQDECFGIQYPEGSPQCSQCSNPVAKFGDTCDGCKQLSLELEADEAWTFWLSTLKTAWSAGDMDTFNMKIGGWKYVGGDIEREQHSKGVSIAKANNLRFLAPGHNGFAIFTRQNDKMPTVTIQGGKDYSSPDWSASFTSGTPHEIILAASNAVIHTN